MYIKTISALVLLLELVNPSTAAPHIEKRSFTLDRTRNTAFTGRDGPSAMAKAYRKYRVPLPPALANHLETRQLKQSTLAKRQGYKWHRLGADDAPSASSVAVRAKANTAGGAGNAADSAIDAVIDSLTGGGGGGGGLGGLGGDAAAGAGGGGDASVGNAGAGNADAGARPSSGASLNATPGCQPQLSKSNDTSRQAGAVAAIPVKDDTEYISTIKIAGQSVPVDFDTGSADLWVFNTGLPPDQKTQRTVYDPKKSKTFKLMPGAKFLISYGDGSGAAGNVGTDVVEVGGVVSPNQAVEVPTNVSSSFVKDKANGGLLGLGFPNINTITPKKQNTFAENVKNQLAEPIFAANLRPNAPGSYQFGRVDLSNTTGPPVWSTISSANGFWEFKTSSFSVNDGQPQSMTAGSTAIADTGTTLMLADPKLVKAYYAQVPGAKLDANQGGIVAPCKEKFPDLKIDVGGNMVRVKGEHINYAPLDDGSGDCFGGLQNSPIPKMGVYGDILFKSQVVIFNMGNNSIGMAEHR